MRKLPFEDAKIEKLLLRRQELNDRLIVMKKTAADLEVEAQKMQNEFTKITDQVNGLIKPIVDATEMEEYEVCANVKLDEGKPVMIIINPVEELKEDIKKKNEKNTSSPTDSGADSLESSK